MTKELKTLRNILIKIIDFIDSKRCDNIPKPIVKIASRTIENGFNDITGEVIIPKDEACRELGIGISQFSKEVRNGNLPKPEPLTEVRVGIKQKYIDEYKSRKRSQ